LTSARQQRLTGRLLIKVLVSAIGLVLLMAYLLWPVPSLTLSEGWSGKIVYLQAIQPGQKFGLRFLHSYERGWVEETYKVKDGSSFVLTAHAFQIFNYDSRELTYPGEFHMDDDGFARVTGIEKYREVRFELLPVRVANTVPQFLITGDRVLSLPDMVPKGSLLVVQVKAVRRLATFIAYKPPRAGFP